METEHHLADRSAVNEDERGDGRDDGRSGFGSNSCA